MVNSIVGTELLNRQTISGIHKRIFKTMIEHRTGGSKAGGKSDKTEIRSQRPYLIDKPYGPFQVLNKGVRGEEGREEKGSGSEVVKVLSDKSPWQQCGTQTVGVG